MFLSSNVDIKSIERVWPHMWNVWTMSWDNRFIEQRIEQPTTFKLQIISLAIKILVIQNQPTWNTKSKELISIK